MVEVVVNGEKYNIKENTLLTKMFIENFPLPIEIKEFKSDENFHLNVVLEKGVGNRIYRISMKISDVEIIKFMMEGMDFYSLFWPPVLNFDNSPFRSWFKKEYKLKYLVEFNVDNDKFKYCVSAYRGSYDEEHRLVGLDARWVVKNGNINDFLTGVVVDVSRAKLLYGSNYIGKLFSLLDEFKIFNGVSGVPLSDYAKLLVNIVKEVIVRVDGLKVVELEYRPDSKKIFGVIVANQTNLIMIKDLELNYKTVDFVKSCMIKPEKCKTVL